MADKIGKKHKKYTKKGIKSKSAASNKQKHAHAMEEAVGPADADKAASVSEPAGDTMWPSSNVMAHMESNDGSVWAYWSAHQMTHPTLMAPAYGFFPPPADPWATYGGWCDWGHVPMQ